MKITLDRLQLIAAIEEWDRRALAGELQPTPTGADKADAFIAVLRQVCPGSVEE